MILLFFLLCSVAYGTDLHSDCYNHGSKDGICECLEGYTGFNCELCKRCNYQGSCHGNFKVEGAATDNDGTKECICNKKNGNFIWGGDTCTVPAVCQHNNDCKRGNCVKNLCVCSTYNGRTWLGDTCNIEPTCPDGCFNGTCTMELGTEITSGLIRAVSTGKNCICEDGYGGVACDKVLVPECNNKGYLEGGTCVCEEGYGDDCSCDHECAWDNIVGGDMKCSVENNANRGKCECKSGFEQPDCTCKENQCSGHGSCLKEGCDCEEGWMNYQCSGHGECNGGECTCHPRFKGEMCNVLEPMLTCEQGQHYMENGIYYEEGGACDVVENRNTYFGRDYNLHPLQSIQYEATSWTDCHQKCMDRVDRNVTDESRDIDPLRFEDKYGWGGENPSWANDADIYAHYYGHHRWAKSGDLPSGTYGLRWWRYKGTVGEQTDYDGSKWHSNNFKVRRSCHEFWEGSSFDYYGCKWYVESDSNPRVWEKVGTYDNSGFIDDGSGFYVGNTPSCHPLAYKCTGDAVCDTSHLSQVMGGSGPAPPYEDSWSVRNFGSLNRYSGWQKARDPNWSSYDYFVQPLCLQGDYPPFPKYYKRMQNFETKYNPTHYSYDNGKCTCFGLDEDTCDTTKAITYDPRRSGNQRSQWDNHQPNNLKTVNMPVQRKHGITSYWKRNGEYCMPCFSGYHSVSGTHCCPNGWEGDDCEINIDDCIDDLCDDNVHTCIDDAYAADYDLVLNVSEYACVCKPGLTGTIDSVTGFETCDKECCIDGQSVAPRGGFTDPLTVHGTCKSGVGGCVCDYGYEGPNCECTDSMCDHGYCNVGDSTFCKCHPGYSLDATGKCTVGADFCADNPCVNGNCTNTENDYHCKCEVGYIGKNCTIDTNWNIGNTTCPDGYLLNGRCVDCPHGTYSRGPTDTTCRIILTDENIHDAVDSALNDPNGLYGDISTFDTSAVTNMDRLFKDKTVPDISDWDVSSVTSMREMFMGTTKPDTSKWTFHPDVDKFWWERGNVIYSQITCAKVVDGRCQFTNSGLRNTVLAWESAETATENVYGPLATWDVSYVTDMSDLFQDSTKDPDITNWDMSNAVHADRMLLNSGFTHLIDNKDLSSLQTADNMMPTNYATNGGRLCGKHFLRVCEARGYKADTDTGRDVDCANRKGFENMGFCLTSTVPEGESVSIIKQAVNHYYGTDAQNADIIDRHGEMSEWDVSQVQSMRGLFLDNRNGIPPLAKWDTSSVTDMTSMFENSDFNEDIRHWDVRKVDNFNKMFKGNTDFAVDLTFWEIHASDHSNTFFGNPHYDGLLFKINTILPEPLTDVTFQDAVNDWFDADKKDDIIAEYGEISDWLVYEVTDMSNAFKGKTFNADISGWNVGAVTDMSSMFEGSTFNSPIGKWNVDKVRDMSSMFKGSSFNQLIDRWNVSSVEDMSSMFENSVFSRPIGDWDLWGTGWDIVQKPDDGNSKCFAEEGMIITLDPDTRQNLQSNYRLCFDECTGTYPIRLDDIEGRTRSRGGGEVGTHYTPYMAGFAFVEDTSLAYTCQCATKIENCDSSPFDRVLEYRDMKTDNMFTGNDRFIQPLCGIGWRYRDIRSLSPPQRGVSLTCGTCKAREHMSTCGLCLGEFRFDQCLNSPMAFTLKELHDFGGSHGMVGLVVDADGIPLDGSASDDDINNGYVNPYACNCEYEEGMKGCLVVNGRKQVRMKEWYADGEIDFTDKDNGQYYCELDYLNNARSVASAEGFNSVECTEDTLLNQIECGLVGGNWNGKCDKCLKPCDPPELGVKFISTNRKCEKCPEGMTVWNNECVWCPDGKFTDENRAWCGKCPSGTYGVDGECLTCAQGAASTFEGALQCSTCPAGTFSVGTECQDCPTGKSSQNGAWFCYDVAHCRHGETTKITKAGNWCDLCNDGFKHVGGTCVADCVHGDFTVLNGVGTCHCTDMWEGNACDYCDDTKYVHIDETCHATKCDDTLFTDCVCNAGPVINGKLCFNNEPYSECSGDQTGCLCNTGDGYTYVEVGFRCIDSQVVELCGINAISTKDCNNLKIGDKCLEKCARDGQIVHSATHVVLGGVILPLCGGEIKTECYAVPWKVMDYNCGAHVECQDNYFVNTSQMYTGMGNEHASVCCVEKQQCRDFICPATSADRAGDYVVIRTEEGMCNGITFSDRGWFRMTSSLGVLYDTAEEALEECGLGAGESIIAHLEGKGYVCKQQYRDADDYDHETSLQHEEDCDYTWYSSLRITGGTDHTATTYTYAPITSQDHYPIGLVFTTTAGNLNCCVDVCDGKHSDHSCTRPIYGVCGGECTAADFATDGDASSACCEADSWYCDSGTCNNGFKTNTAFCGEKCDETHFTTTINVSEVQAIAMTHGSVICEGEEQVGVDSSGCFEACNSFTNYFVIDDKCFCANNLGGQCTNNITDCSDWCPSGIVTQTYSSISSYFTTCEFSWNNCPAGWFASATDWCRKEYESGTQLSSPDPCVASGTCCEPKMYDTYYISTDVTRTESHCCDVDTSLIACMSKQCPDRYVNNDVYATGFYSTDHTSECCNQIPDTHYCDAHNNGGDFACPDGKRLHYDDVFCSDHCSETQCCTPDNHFCDSLPCEGAEVSTGLDYCGKQCDILQCCKAPPKCDISYDCKNRVSSSSRLDWNYVCTQLENGECASSEYALGKCCISDLSPYCYQDDRYDESESVNVTRVSWDRPTHMGIPMPGCNEKKGYISYYERYGRTGGSFTDESFEGVCCKYVETCPDDIMCPMIGGSQSFLKAGYSASVPRHCAAGSSSDWDRIQQCDDSSMASMCCEPETCAVAGARLTTSSCDEYSCDLCYETNNNFGSSYVDTGGGNYEWVPNKYFGVQLDKAAFQVNCCVPSCEQAKLEIYDSGRGYKNGQPLCGTISGGWNTWKGHSYGGSETDGIFMQPSWIVDNCCYASCGTEAVKQNYSCANFPIKSNYFSSDLIYGITLTAANFKETCCELPPPSCALSSLTQSCPTGLVERGLNNGVHGCKMDWENKGIPCTASHQYQHWFSAPEYWELPRDITNFTQECCLAPGSNGYIDW